MTSDAARLERIEAHIAIADLVHGYARFVRRDMPGEVSGLFTPDGSFEVRDGFPDSDEFTTRYRLEGADHIRVQMDGNKGQPHPVPLIHNLMIEVDGDSASANCVMEGQIFGTGQGVFGEYRDSFRRVDGEWRFASRIFTIFGKA